MSSWTIRGTCVLSVASHWLKSTRFIVREASRPEARLESPACLLKLEPERIWILPEPDGPGAPADTSPDPL
eukprot:g65624.t1